tara:strand:+ start:205 stop:339 length:135 start_codon:yes stop_codon:yes gene_type:complete
MDGHSQKVIEQVSKTTLFRMPTREKQPAELFYTFKWMIKEEYHG